VLIYGESGTGKELVARAVHDASPRRDKPFVPINCAAIPESLIEDELFGHTRGAFTGAEAARQGRIASADGGTLFLDEIGDMPIIAQAKLLRVLQERALTPVGGDRSIPVDIRVVAATNRDLDAMVAAGSFRADLLFRLRVIEVRLPPLRDRGDDILTLARSFLAQANRRNNRSVTGFDPAAESTLAGHAWPGNVRELANTIERAVILKRQGLLSAADLRLTGKRGAPAAAPAAAAPDDLNLRSTLDKTEKRLIAIALERSAGNRTEAAALLGLNRTTLVEKMKRVVEG
jgi:transcriptional regulator with GAF, ATPase, and Fis domain